MKNVHSINSHKIVCKECYSSLESGVDDGAHDMRTKNLHELTKDNDEKDKHISKLQLELKTFFDKSVDMESELIAIRNLNKKVQALESLIARSSDDKNNVIMMDKNDNLNIQTKKDITPLVTTNDVLNLKSNGNPKENNEGEVNFEEDGARKATDDEKNGATDASISEPVYVAIKERMKNVHSINSHKIVCKECYSSLESGVDDGAHDMRTKNLHELTKDNDEKDKHISKLQLELKTFFDKSVDMESELIAIRNLNKKVQALESLIARSSDDKNNVIMMDKNDNLNIQTKKDITPLVTTNDVLNLKSNGNPKENNEGEVNFEEDGARKATDDEKNGATDASISEPVYVAIKEVSTKKI
ncbi:hypothetical protein JTB14_022197 [Gonioctena quinquepunctata]|nr:hypothetical protein JTB14_022197 [Gonioctena quinquepunctata]